MNRSSEQRISFLLIFLMGFSFLLWCYLFRSFLNAGAPLQGDAYSYLGHMRFYLENIMRGVYPLWYPWDHNGTTNEFFLRRIGEFNPFFLIIVFFNKIGLSFLMAYRLFLALYFFLGVAGFYLLGRKLFGDRLSSFCAALLFLFSCIGAGIFETYLVLEIVPFIWFSFFCVAFMQAPREVFFLGAVFSLMLINITYIPFYFYTILFVFLVCFFAVYAFQIGRIFGQTKDFIGRHKIFTCGCFALVAVSFIPGLSWYQQTNKGDILTLQRHIGSQELNSTAVSIDKVNEGGINPNFIFDRQFVNTDKVGLHEFYVPLFAFLMLLAGAWGRLNRRLVVFFIFGFTVFLIGLADASYIHKFLYNHVPFFKYFRNVQFFLQFAILPVFILFVAEQMRIFVEDCEKSLLDRKWMTLWVGLVHGAAAGLFLYVHGGYITYAVIIFNLGWMLGRIWSKGNSWIWALLLWAAIVLQPFEVYSHIAINYPPSYQWGYDVGNSLRLPSVKEAGQMLDLKEKSAPGMSPDLPYFSTRWLYEAIESVDGVILKNYLSAPFIVYDRVQQAADNISSGRLQYSLAHFENLVFVYADTMSGAQGPVPPQARIITSTDTDFKIIKFDSNDVIVRTTLTKPVFLLRTQNYYSQWKASIDGKPAVLLRANICAQGLWVPAGEHLVHWHFGAALNYAWAYFLVVLYPLVLIRLIWLWFHSRVPAQKSSI